MVLEDYMTNQNHYVSPNKVPMVTKLCIMVTYLEVPLHRVTRHIDRGILSCEVLCLPYHSATTLATKRGRVLTYNEWLPTTKLLDPLATWSWKIELKPLYLHYQCVYGHQTWQMVSQLEGLLPI